jgi:hypothetical protein
MQELYEFMTSFVASYKHLPRHSPLRSLSNVLDMIFNVGRTFILTSPFTLGAILIIQMLPPSKLLTIRTE